MKVKKILVPIDSSVSSYGAAEYSIDLALSLKSELAFLFVTDKSKAIGNIDSGLSEEQALEIIRKEEFTAVDQITNLCTRKGIRPLKFFFDGNPAQEILHTAAAWQTDLIVIGRHHKNFLEKFLLKSVSEEVLRKSKIPVLLLPIYE